MDFKKSGPLRKNGLYVLCLQAMDLFDLSEIFGDIHSALSRVKCPVMIFGVKTDALIPIWQQRELAQQLQAAG